MSGNWQGQQWDGQDGWQNWDGWSWWQPRGAPTQWTQGQQQGDGQGHWGVQARANALHDGRQLRRSQTQRQDAAQHTHQGQQHQPDAQPKQTPRGKPHPKRKDAAVDKTVIIDTSAPAPGPGTPLQGIPAHMMDSGQGQGGASASGHQPGDGAQQSGPVQGGGGTHQPGPVQGGDGAPQPGPAQGQAGAPQPGPAGHQSGDGAPGLQGQDGAQQTGGAQQPGRGHQGPDGDGGDGAQQHSQGQFWQTRPPWPRTTPVTQFADRSRAQSVPAWRYNTRVPRQYDGELSRPPRQLGDEELRTVGFVFCLSLSLTDYMLSASSSGRVRRARRTGSHQNCCSICHRTSSASQRSISTEGVSRFQGFVSLL